MTKEGKQAATPGSGGKKKDQDEVEHTPPVNQAPPPPIATVDGQAVMTYLEGLADQMNQINARMSRVERSSVQNDKLTETKQRKGTSHGEKDIPQGHDERGSRISKGSGQKPASSKARSTSVLDHVGKKLSEHDLRLKLENCKKEREKRKNPWIREAQRKNKQRLLRKDVNTPRPGGRSDVGAETIMKRSHKCEQEEGDTASDLRAHTILVTRVVTEREKLLEKATPLTDYNKRDTSKYCAYHEATEHDTADCRQLKDEIETLIRQGKLTEWIIKEVQRHKTDYHTVPPPPPEDKERVPRAESIHIILGRSHIGGNSRKAMDREADDIVFRENDAKWVHYPHTDALVIKMKIGMVNVHQAMVDTGSSANVLTYDTYKKLGLLDRELTSMGGHLYGFTGNSIGVKGTIRLLVIIGEEPYVATHIAMFTVVDRPCAYNVIVGRPLMRAMRMVTSIHHMTVKFPTPTGVGFLKSCQYESRVCYNQALRVAESENASKEMVQPGEDDVLMEEAEGRKRVRLEGHETCNLISIEELSENYFEHMGIQVEPHTGALLIEASQHIMLIQEGIMEEASDEEERPEQIAVRLRKGKWAREETTTTMDLPNKITRTVTTTSERLINPARDHQPELEDTEGLMITEVGESSEARADLDPRMPPMVERAGAAEDIIPILVDPNDPSKVHIIGSNLSPDLRDDLARFLRRNLDVFAWSHSDMIGIDPNVICHRLNLDPKKKGVRQKRWSISGERAEALREEVDRLMEAGLVREAFYPMWPANPVLVKKLNGKWRTCVDFTDLNKACPKDSFPLPRIDQLEFFNAIKGVGRNFEWTEKCEEAFQNIKKHLSSPPILSNPKEGETLVLYLAVSDFAVSAVLVREEDSIYLPVYYVSKRLADAETRYTSLEKLAYALILASRKLRPYFQAHRIEVRTSYPLRQVMYKPESSSRMLKWTVELGQFEVDYKPRTAIKGQALTDFLLEFPPHQEVESGALVVIPRTKEVGLESQNSAPWWSLFVDGASNGDGAGAGIELISPETHKIRRMTNLAFHATNNNAEYEALINGLKLALEMKVENLNVFSDSMIVVYQINGGYQVKGPRTELYLKCAQRILAKFNEVRLELIPHGQNEGADELTKLGSHREATILGVVPLNIQRQPSMPEHEVGNLSDDLGPTWMTPILAYIKKASLPDEMNEARRVRYKGSRYMIYDGILYRRGFSVPLPKCIDGDECNYILREVHEGIYGNHSGVALWLRKSSIKATTGQR
ncbi:uncharacterized protein LOC141691843 [Apium graveolens]|uniref:uncharacterized protein LOC141691843 n=1 Tax=Apium graveolens TaxID=4045 RepID=UPI003D793866